MTDAQAREANLLILHRPKYYRFIDLSRQYYGLFCARGAHMTKFNLNDHDWYPVRQQDERDEVVKNGERITVYQAEMITGIRLS